MTIQIIKITINNDGETGEPLNRTAMFTITAGGGAVYSWSRGGIPLTGGVQAFLDAEEAQLWTEASTTGNLATATELEIAGARAWYLANAGAKADVFDKSVAQMVTDITAMVNASFPSASAAIKTGWIRTLVSSLLDTRVNAHDRDLV